MTATDSGKILIVDDDRIALDLYTRMLKHHGVKNFLTVSDSRHVLDLLKSESIHLVLLDLHMPVLSGHELLPRLREQYPEVPVIIISASTDLQQAVECMKQGAFDYLLKPVEFELMVKTLRKALEWKTLSDQFHDLKDHLVDNKLDSPGAFAAIVTRSPKMRSLFQYLEVVARSSQPILITGESGTGKELIARSIYSLSGCSGELVSVNLAGLDDATFSDTLFGHKRGAFTGAEQMREGLVAKATGGLLFLDEIGDMGELSQIKLLRLIQEREFYPVGSDTPRRCEARIVCASNKDIKKMVAAGTFRNDLYYRLNVHHVSLPPLRERKEDLPLLLQHFINDSAENLGTKPPAYPLELLELLSTYHFPGNIRELQGMVSDAVARQRSKMLSLEPFRNTIAKGQAGQNAPTLATGDTPSGQNILQAVWGHFPTLNEAEEFIIDTALDIAKGNQGIAATMLGLKRQTLNMRLKARKARS